VTCANFDSFPVETMDCANSCDCTTSGC
jgi:hypothetical protein